MKKITSFIVLGILMVATMIATASTTFAYTTSGISYIQSGSNIYVALNGNTDLAAFGFGGFVAGEGSVDIDLRDFSGYDIANTYKLVFEQNGVSISSTWGSAFEESVRLWAYEDGQDGVSFEVYSKNGVLTYEPFADYSVQSAKIYWTVTVADASPVISGETAIVTTVDNPYTETYIRSLISAYDDVDGSLTHAIVLVTDGYSANKTTLGTYDIDYSVTDSAGNTAYLTVTVLVKDVLAPVGTNSTASISYTQTFNLSSYITGTLPSKFADNYYSDAQLTFAIANDGYTTHKTVPGSYVVQFKATDPSGNVGYMNLTITVFDDVLPVFSGPTTITKSATETLTLTQIKAQITANDAINGNLTTSIQVVEDNFTGFGNIVGSYTVKFSVTDSSNNVAYHTVTISVVDNIPPVFYVADGYFISTSQAVTLTLEDFKDILVATGQITVDGSGNVTILSAYNEYFGHENEPGIYALTLTGTAVNGDEYIWNLAVEVLVDETGDSVVAEDLPWYQDFYNENQEIVLSIAGVLAVVLLIVSIRAINKSVKKAQRKSNKRK